MEEISEADILFEDNHLIAINKRAGQLSQPDNDGNPGLEYYVKQYIAHKYNKPGEVFLGSIHRLDQPTTGVILFARTSKAHVRMEKLFREREIEKTYWALTQKKPKELKGSLKHYVYQMPEKNIMKITSDPDRAGAKLAEMDYKYLRSVRGVHLYQVLLKTGRKHQIRVQLSTIGGPIIGDLKYGYKNPLPDASVALHARSLAFIHPVQKVPIKIIAPLPKQIESWDLFANEDD